MYEIEVVYSDPETHRNRRAWVVKGRRRDGGGYEVVLVHNHGNRRIAKWARAAWCHAFIRHNRVRFPIGAVITINTLDGAGEAVRKKEERWTCP